MNSVVLPRLSMIHEQEIASDSYQIRTAITIDNYNHRYWKKVAAGKPLR